MNYQTKDFKKLKNTWYKKLKQSGFEDAENSQDELKQWASRVFKEKRNGSFYNEKEVYYKSREEYYRLAGRFYHDHAFEDVLDKTIWAYHVEGLSIRDIVKVLKSKKQKSIYLNRIQDIVKRLSTIMLNSNGIKT